MNASSAYSDLFWFPSLFLVLLFYAQSAVLKPAEHEVPASEEIEEVETEHVEVAREGTRAEATAGGDCVEPGCAIAISHPALNANAFRYREPRMAPILPYHNWPLSSLSPLLSVATGRRSPTTTVQGGRRPWSLGAPCA